jgi:hypothetical protein
VTRGAAHSCKVTNPGLVGSGTTLPAKVKDSGKVGPVRISWQLCLLFCMHSHLLARSPSFRTVFRTDSDDVDQRKRSDVRDRGGAGQFSSPDRFTSDDTSGSGDFRAAQVESDDDPAAFGGHGAKPSVADRAKGTSFLALVGAL